MSRPGITYQDVANTAQTLQAQGINPTIEGIRKITGTGSNGTIAPLLRKWKDAQTESHKIANKENLPEQLIILMKELWAEVITQAETKVASIEETYQKSTEELQQEFQKYKTNNQRWQNLYNQWLQEKSQLTNDKLSLEAAIAELQKAAALSNSKQEGLAQQLEEKQERIVELHRLQNQSQANLEHYRESAREQRIMEQQRYEQQQQGLEQTISQLQQKLTLITQDKSQLQQQYDKIVFENDAVKIEHEELKDQLIKLQDKYSCIENEFNQSIQAKNHWQSQCQELQKKIGEENVSFIESQKENAVLSQQLYSIQNQVKDLNNQNKSLALEKWEIAQEKAQLEGQLKQMEKLLKNRKETLPS